MLGRHHWLISLRCQGSVFNIAVHRVLDLVSSKGGPQGWQMFAGFQPAEAFGRLPHGSAGPAQRHGGIVPAFDVAADAADRAVHVLDDVGAGQRAAQFGRQAQAADGEDFIQPFQNGAGNARGVVVQAAGRDCGEASRLLLHRSVPTPAATPCARLLAEIWASAP